MRTKSRVTRHWAGSLAVLLVGMLLLASGPSTGAGPSPAAAAERAGSCMKIVVPAYFHSGKEWKQAIKAAPATGLIILNPNSGPDRYDAKWCVNGSLSG